jgi:hypothetical protein
VPIRCVIPQVVHPDVDQSASDPPADNAFGEAGVDHLRKDRDDVESHGEIYESTDLRIDELKSVNS